MSTCVGKESLYSMLCYAILCYGMEWNMLFYGISMLCYEIWMVCYAMVYVVKDKQRATVETLVFTSEQFCFKTTNFWMFNSQQYFQCFDSRTSFHCIFF